MMVRFDIRSVLGCAVLAAVSDASFVSARQSNITVAPPPSRDPFYVVPDGIADLDPGTILRHRRPLSPIAAFGWHPDNLQDTHQILYRTTDTFDNATATVVTVLIPENADRSKVVSFQVAEDAATIDCAPSYAFQLQSESYPLLNSPTAEVQLLLIEGALARGWVVIVADVEGPKGVYGANKLAGQIVLDGIRAALGSGSFTGVDKMAKVAMWGYSGGSGITKVAAELQPLYAPELEIAGAAIGGTGSSDTAGLSKINKSPDSHLLAVGILGLSNEFTELRDAIDLHLKPEFRRVFYKPLHQCLEANNLTFLNRDILGMFDDPTAIVTNPAFTKAFKDETEPNPAIPFFWYQAVNDALAPIKETDAQVDKYCADGVSVEYIRNSAPTIHHTNYGLVGAPTALTWLGGILDGKRPKPGCLKATVFLAELDPAFLALFPEALQGSLLDFTAGG